MGKSLSSLIAIALILCSCGPKPSGGSSAAAASSATDNSGLTPDVAAALIAANLPPAPCGAQWRQGNFGDDMGTNTAGREEGELLAHWIDKHIFQNPAQFTLQSDGSDQPKEPDSFGQYQRVTAREYRDPDGNPVKINLYESKFRNGHRDGQVSYSEQRSATLAFCSYVNDGVSILDTTVDQTGKSAEVIFVQKTKPTTMANIIDSDTTIGHPDFSSVPAPQRHARLRRLDATGWQLEGTF
jgi:hypothetical protein